MAPLFPNLVGSERLRIVIPISPSFLLLIQFRSPMLGCSEEEEIPGVLDLSSPTAPTLHHCSSAKKEALDEIVVAASRLAGIDELNLTEASLEDVFLQLTGRGLRE
jgi:hypothetical protein